MIFWLLAGYCTSLLVRFSIKWHFKNEIKFLVIKIFRPKAWRTHVQLFGFYILWPKPFFYLSVKKKHKIYGTIFEFWLRINFNFSYKFFLVPKTESELNEYKKVSILQLLKNLDFFSKYIICKLIIFYIYFTRNFVLIPSLFSDLVQYFGR